MNRLLAALLLLAPLIVHAQAADDLVLLHQGRLLDANDRPVGATLAMRFSLYASHDAQADTTAIWSETYEVPVLEGAYAIALGSTLGANSGKKALPASVFATEARYLAVRVGDGTELLPRLRLGTVPNAARARLAARAEVAAKVEAGGVDTAAIADGAVTLEKLARTDGKVTGLDADKLDGLDATAFAPASIRDELATGLAAANDGIDALEVAVDATQTSVTEASALAAGRLAKVTTTAGALTGAGTAADPLGLSIGTGAGSVAAGNHSHDALYARLGAANTFTQEQAFREGADFLGTEAKNFRFQLADTAPRTCDDSAKGVAYFDTALNVLRVCGGASTGWTDTRTPCISGEQTCPALSCKAILAARPAAETGSYWIDPDGTGAIAPVKVACDMTTNGGGWTRVVNVRGGSGAHADQTGAAGDMNDPNATAKLSDAAINLLNTVGYFRWQCGAGYHAFVKNAANTWTSARTNSQSWSLDRNRDGTFECAANRAGYVFSDANACSSGHTNYAASSASEGTGCYVAGEGWSLNGALWAK